MLLRQCSIWSLTVEDSSGETKRLLTLEVRSKDRLIVQARGPNNREPDNHERLNWIASNRLRTASRMAFCWVPSDTAFEITIVSASTRKRTRLDSVTFLTVGIASRRSESRMRVSRTICR